MNVCFEGNVLEELLGLLRLEKIEENIFRGQSQDLGFGNVFGGQLMGQALSAAYRTVTGALNAHSLHGYFMRAGDAACPIVYTVDRIRDGRSFATRRVKAVQKGRAIFSMSGVGFSSSTFSTQGVGNESIPYKAPASSPVIPAIVSASRPILVAPMMACFVSSPAIAQIANAQGTISIVQTASQGGNVTKNSL